MSLPPEINLRNSNAESMMSTVNRNVSNNNIMKACETAGELERPTDVYDGSAMFRSDRCEPSRNQAGNPSF